MAESCASDARCGNHGRNFGAEKLFLAIVGVDETLKRRDIPEDLGMAEPGVRPAVRIRALKGLAAADDLGVKAVEEGFDEPLSRNK
jgi:hypothetical protein